MNKFSSVAAIRFAGPRVPEAVAEVAMTVAAAAFTAVVWLSIGAWAISPDQPMQAAANRAAPAAQHITLPTVVIVGRRDSLEGTPATTTAQNTAANPVTLNQ